MGVRDNLMINRNTDEEAEKLSEMLKDTAKKEDVQEILEKVVDPEYMYASGSEISITGKGKFYYGYVRVAVPEDKESVTEIIVDGNVIAQMISRYSAGTQHYMYINNKEQMRGEDYYFYGGAGSTRHNTTSSFTNTIKGKLDKDSRHSSEYTSKICVDYYYIDKYIEFNESFQIKNSTNNAKANVCYSLDED